MLRSFDEGSAGGAALLHEVEAPHQPAARDLLSHRAPALQSIRRPTSSLSPGPPAQGTWGSRRSSSVRPPDVGAPEIRRRNDEDLGRHLACGPWPSSNPYRMRSGAPCACRTLLMHRVSAIRTCPDSTRGSDAHRPDSAAPRVRCADSGPQRTSYDRGPRWPFAGGVVWALRRDRGRSWAGPPRDHPAGLLLGAAAVTGAAGNASLAVLGLVLSIPLLRRLYGRFGTWRAPAVAIALFTEMFALSALVIGPAITGAGQPDPTPKPGVAPTAPGPSRTATDHDVHHLTE